MDDINNSSWFENFIKDLRVANENYFRWARASGHSSVGDEYRSPKVFIRNSDGAYKEATVSLDTSLGIVVHEKES